MSNYAIILGVDKYKYASALPSCENDANLMEGLLTATGKYKVLRIANNAAKHQIQEEISSFLPIDSTDIGEVLFCFILVVMENRMNRVCIMHCAIPM